MEGTGWKWTVAYPLDAQFGCRDWENNPTSFRDRVSYRRQLDQG